LISIVRGLGSEDQRNAIHDNTADYHFVGYCSTALATPLFVVLALLFRESSSPQTKFTFAVSNKSTTANYVCALTLSWWVYYHQK